MSKRAKELDRALKARCMLEIAARAEVLRDVERLTLGSWRISENQLRELLNELRRKYGVKVEP